MSKFLVLFTMVFFMTGAGDAEAKDYPIFDGQKYNGLYYPRIDIIEWGKPAHLEFHVYSKDEPIEIEAKPVERGGKRVLMVNYYFAKRKEKVCRSVVAPANFSPESKLYFYKDSSDNEYDNIYVSVDPQKTSKNIQTYASKEWTETGCEDDKSATADSGAATSNGTSRSVASSGTPAPAVLTDTSEGAPAANPPAKKAPADPKKELIDYENNAMPYNF